MSVRLVVAALILSLLSVHYFEEAFLPLVSVARLAVYGEQSFSSALTGCSTLDPDGEWVHPATLSLTVYGDVQAVLERAYGPHGKEVLPKYSEVRKGNDELLCVAEFLLATGSRQFLADRNVLVFPFDIEQTKYGLRNGWVSGLAQGLVGQVFLGAFLASEDERYLEAAKQTGLLLSVDLEEGGVRVQMPNDEVWYEEYAQVGADPPLVLNGHLLALDFLYWMNQIENDSIWAGMFQSGVQATISQVENYQGFAWSYYDQRSNFATRKYQTFHVRQLDRYAIHDDTGSLSQGSARMRWQLYFPLGMIQRIVTQPSRLLIFLTLLLFAVYLPVVWFVFHRFRSTRANQA